MKIPGVALALLFALCSPTLRAQPLGPKPACQPTFPLQTGVTDGWQGADAAYSAPLSRSRSLWTFGDTLFGPERAMDGANPRMVNNSLALSSCSAAGWKVNYLLRQGPGGEPVSFFRPQDDSHWYWAMDVAHYRNEFLIMLLCLRHPAVQGEPAFNFEACGMDLARLSTAGDPRSGRSTIQPIVRDGAKAYPAASMLIHGGNLYLFGARESADHALFVSRVPLRQLSNAAHALTTLTEHAGWQSGVPLSKAKPLFQPAPTELTVRYHSVWKRWLAIYKEPDLLSDRILLRSAASLTGPWSAPTLLFNIRLLDAAARLPGAFCYAGKEHPEFASGNSLLVTYVCNALNPTILLKHTELYAPKAVTVTLDPQLRVKQVSSAVTEAPTTIGHKAR